MKRISMLSAAILALVLMFSVAQTTQASNENTNQNVTFSQQFDGMTTIIDGKCGGATSTEKKTEVKAKSKNQENKCGEGKCGEATSKTEKKTEKKQVQTSEKSEEHKCGEGKCGEAGTKTEKSTSKKAKSGESKCGTGKCGVA